MIRTTFRLPTILVIKQVALLAKCRLPTLEQQSHLREHNFKIWSPHRRFDSGDKTGGFSGQVPASYVEQQSHLREHTLQNVESPPAIVHSASLKNTW
jgi:hypothetical protein